MVDLQNDQSDDDSFHSFHDDEPSLPHVERPPPPSTPSAPPEDIQAIPRAAAERFPPDEEAALLTESHTLKASANHLFATGAFDDAIQKYDRARAACPDYLDYEMAVLRSNTSACQLKLQEWKDAVDSATAAMERLERLEPLPVPEPEPERGSEAAAAARQAPARNNAVVEEVNDDTAARIAALQASGHTLAEVRKLQAKVLTRRATARTQQGGWASMQGAQEDYRVLLSAEMEGSLGPMDRRRVVEAARRLGPQLTAARDKEMAEMMGKLKGLGNSVLKPFGLSTDNFQFVQDEKTGGYSMNFDQNAGSKG